MVFILKHSGAPWFYIRKTGGGLLGPLELFLKGKGIFAFKIILKNVGRSGLLLSVELRVTEPKLVLNNSFSRLFGRKDMFTDIPSPLNLVPLPLIRHYVFI